jgi:hypothetical protein
LHGIEGVDSVRCRICGDHRRVISGRHLSKHDIDRQGVHGGIPAQSRRTDRAE